MRKYKTLIVIIVCLALVALVVPLASGCSGEVGKRPLRWVS